jgi:hypothetical protein
MIITIPGIVITMTPESLLRSFRNGHHHHSGIAITMPRNPHPPNGSLRPRLFLALAPALQACEHTEEQSSVLGRKT